MMTKRLLLFAILSLGFINLHAQNCPEYSNVATGLGKACGNQIYTMSVPNTGCDGEIYIDVQGSLGFGGSWEIVSDLTGNTVGSGSTFFGGSVNTSIGPLDPNIVGTAFNLIVDNGTISTKQNGNTIVTCAGGNNHFSVEITISSASITIDTPSGSITNIVKNCNDFIVQVPLANTNFCTQLTVDLPWEITCDKDGSIISSGTHTVTIYPQVPSDANDLVDISWNATTCSWDISPNNDCDVLDIGTIFDISPDPSSLNYNCSNGNESFDVNYLGFTNSPNCCATAGPLTNITYDETYTTSDAVPKSSPFGGVNNSAYINIPPNNSGGNATSLDLCVDVTNYCRTLIGNESNTYYVLIFIDGIEVFGSGQISVNNYSTCIDITDASGGYNQSGEVEVYVLPNNFNSSGINTTYAPANSCGSMSQGQWKADIDVTFDVLFEEMIGTPVVCTFPLTEAYTSCGSTISPDIDTTGATCNTEGSATIINYDASHTYDFSPSGPTVSATGAINGAIPGQSYDVTATDAGCTSSATTFTLDDQLDAPTFTTSINEPSCGDSNGEIVITPDPGSSITEYSIDNGTSSQPTGTFSGLGAGTYSILVTDINGCQATGTETLNDLASTDDASFVLTDFCAGIANSANITGTLGGTFSIVSPSGDGATIDPNTGEVLNGTGGTTYTIKYETTGSCSDAKTETVTVKPNPEITVSSTDPTCGDNNGEIEISPVSGSITSYSVDNGTTTQSNSTFPNLSAGTYTIQVEGTNGCVTVETKTLTNVGTSDNASFSLTDFCVGTSNSANITGTPGGTFSIVSPTGDGATIDPSTGEITDGVGGSTYTIKYETSGACSVTNTEGVTVNPSPTYTVSTAEPSCGNNDGEITIVPDPGVTISDFSIDNGASTQNGGSFPNLSAGNYTVYVKDIMGCVSTGIESLSNQNGPTIDNMDTTNPSCSNNDGEMVVHASGGTDPLTYEWFDVNNVSIGTGSSPTGLSGGDYTVEVTDDNGCVATGSGTLASPPATDDASFELSDFCVSSSNNASNIATPGGIFSINAPSGDGAIIDPSTGEISNGVEGTTYNVEYTTLGACPSSSTEQVTILPAPNVTFVATPNGGVPPLTVEFENTTFDADHFIWNFGIGDTVHDNGIDFSILYENTGEYTVLLTGLNNHGCMDTAMLHIVVKSPEMKYDFPNIFTPNNDGDNDIFKLISSQGIDALDIIILNRWGNLVYKSDKVNFNWNGLVNNSGGKCDDGTYFYKAQLIGLDGTEKMEHGFVQLSRDK